jgi:hypothetical protein
MPLIPEEPEDFTRETGGRILCCPVEDENDRVAGRFRVYYADFVSAENHGVSPIDVVDKHQHTVDYSIAIFDSNGAPFSTRLQKLFDDEIWSFNFLIRSDLS